MSEFTLEVLGANATAPTSHGASSSYLLSGRTGYILVDAGPGSLMAYTAKHDLEDLRGIVVTHLHADHSLDLMAWAYRWTFPSVRPTIPLYVPAGEERKLGDFDDLFGIPTLPTMVNPITGNFDVRGLPLDGETMFDIDGVSFVSFAARHAVPSAALRFEQDGRTITFSSDTGDCAGLRDAAMGADVFISEATYLEPDLKAMAEHGHLTPALAGEIARDCQVGRLIITHLANPDDGEESQRRASETFGGPVDVAVAGFSVGIVSE